MDWNEFFERTRLAAGVESFSKLAPMLGITDGAIGHYRQGRRIPQVWVVADALRIQGHPAPEKAAIEIMKKAALTSPERTFWKRLAATATLLALGVLGAAQQPVQAATRAFEAAPTPYYAKSWMGDGPTARLLPARLPHRIAVGLGCPAGHPSWYPDCPGVPGYSVSGTHQRSLAPTLGALSVFALRGSAALHELREYLRQRLRVRQDVEHTATFERRLDHQFVEIGRHVDAAVGDAVVVRLRRCEPFRAPL